jgi:hypothetical protein
MCVAVSPLGASVSEALPNYRISQLLLLLHQLHIKLANKTTCKEPMEPFPQILTSQFGELF